VRLLYAYVTLAAAVETRRQQCMPTGIQLQPFSVSSYFASPTSSSYSLFFELVVKMQLNA